MGIDLATWRARIGLNYCRRHAGQSRYSCRPFPVLGRTARWRVEEVINSTPLLLQGCMAVVSLSLILGYRFRGRTFWRCGCGKVGRPKLRDGSVPNAEVGGMADTGIIGVCLLLGVCTVVLALLLMAGDVERNPGPTGKEGGIYGICSLCVAGVKRIQSPREPNPGQIRYASDFDPALADSIQGINGAIEFPLSTSQSDH